MVDAQTIGVLVTAASVSVAAVYYIMTLRVQQRNMRLTLETRRIALIENIATKILNQDGLRNVFELYNYEWTDYEDFERKYGSENDVDAAARRFSTWFAYNTIGTMLRKGVVGIEDLYDMGLQAITYFWEKYRPVVEECRRRYNGEGFCRDMEYLAVEMLRYMQMREPSYRIPEKLDKFDPNM